MQHFLNLGIQLTAEGDAFEAIFPMEKLIPENHEFLFRFLSADLGRIDRLLREGLEKRSSAPVLEAFMALQGVHPYFNNGDAARFRINCELASRIWGVDVDTADADKLFSSLCLLSEHQESDPEFWRYTIQSDVPCTIQALIRFQEDLRNKVFLLLDQSNPAIAQIPYSVRSGIYGLVADNPRETGNTQEPLFQIPQSFYALPHSEAVSVLSASMSFDEAFAQKVLAEIKSLHFNPSAPATFLTSIAKSMSSQSKDADGYIEYSIHSLEDLLNLEIYGLISNRTAVRKCSRCGRYFTYAPADPKADVPSETEAIRSDYCDYKDADGVSCRSLAMDKQFRGEFTHFYQQEYRTRFARVKAGKYTMAQLDEWRKNVAPLKQKVFSGEISLQEYRSLIKKA